MFCSFSNADKGKAKRAIEDMYQPIRVASFVQDEEHLMDNVQVGRLETVMRSAISVISKILSGNEKVF